jgi:hypothetical protein
LLDDVDDSYLQTLHTLGIVDQAQLESAHLTGVVDNSPLESLAPSMGDVHPAVLEAQEVGIIKTD